MRIILAMLVAALTALPAAAQTHAELLEKAIYMEEVVGDVEEAVGLYQRILSTPSAGGRAAAVAQRRLPAALAKTRDGARKAGSVASSSTQQFRYSPRGIEFGVPAGWIIAPPVDTTGGGAETVLTHVATGRTVSVYMITSPDSDEPATTFIEQWITRRIGQPATTFEMRGEGHLTEGSSSPGYAYIQGNFSPRGSATAQMLHAGWAVARDSHLVFMELAPTADPALLPDLWAEIKDSIVM